MSQTLVLARERWVIEIWEYSRRASSSGREENMGNLKMFLEQQEGREERKDESEPAISLEISHFQNGKCEWWNAIEANHATLERELIINFRNEKKYFLINETSLGCQPPHFCVLWDSLRIDKMWGIKFLSCSQEQPRGGGKSCNRGTWHNDESYHVASSSSSSSSRRCVA